MDPQNEMETSETEAKSSSSTEIKSDSEQLSKTLDGVDLSSSEFTVADNPFLDFENFTKFYEVKKKRI